MQHTITLSYIKRRPMKTNILNLFILFSCTPTIYTMDTEDKAFVDRWKNVCMAIGDGDIQQFNEHITDKVAACAVPPISFSPNLLGVAAMWKTAHTKVMIKKLIDRGANPNRLLYLILDDQARPTYPLDLAVIYGNVAAVSTLINQGADPEVTHYLKNTPWFARFFRWITFSSYPEAPLGYVQFMKDNLQILKKNQKYKDLANYNELLQIEEILTKK